jgi:pimeloyl-ACP methyl ester carboxylesterase
VVKAHIPVALNVAVGGSGRPIVLLHGFPQTHLMWRHVAADLASDHTVICPDLRGYGDSDKPTDTDGQTYAKRTMAADIVALAAAVGGAAARPAPPPPTPAAPWSPSEPDSTTPTRSPTSPRWTSCPPWTCGT